ncbi:MAG TPA: hypothetical protein VH120_10550, partial [Gemmataceae bacterium]|nr:hypothetical protein [Gemmataceae bacterium]
MRPNRSHAGVWRWFLAASTLLVAGRDGLAQDTKDKEVLEAIKNHFKTVTPELRRYEGVTLYGETLS